jgi:hypothetical protein
VRSEDAEDLGFGEVEAESFHSDFKFVVVDAFVFVEVEETELGGGIGVRRGDFLLLVFWEFGVSIYDGLRGGGYTASFISSLCSSVNSESPL